VFHTLARVSAQRGQHKLIGSSQVGSIHAIRTNRCARRQSRTEPWSMWIGYDAAEQVPTDNGDMLGGRHVGLHPLFGNRAFGVRTNAGGSLTLRRIRAAHRSIHLKEPANSTCFRQESRDGGSYESISTRRHLIWRLREPGDAMQNSPRFSIPNYGHLFRNARLGTRWTSLFVVRTII
jgi:hypothetical protein